MAALTGGYCDIPSSVGAVLGHPCLLWVGPAQQDSFMVYQDKVFYCAAFYPRSIQEVWSAFAAHISTMAAGKKRGIAWPGGRAGFAVFFLLDNI